MHCTDIRHLAGIATVLASTLWLSACGAGRLPAWPAPSTNPAPVSTRTPAPSDAAPGRGMSWPDANAPTARNGVGAPAPGLQAPRRARTWAEFRLFAAQRMVAANKAITYDGAVPEPLLAIPVLEVELNGDGSVRRIQVSRTPSQATDTVQLAIDAVKRAAPFGDVSHLPKPWKFSEVFLFDDHRRFKPRTLDL